VIVGIGIDVVAIERMARLVGDGPRSERFLQRCFTARERAYCDARRDRANRYAVRFAAKEAMVKALGAPRGVRWTDIEVAREEGKPRLALSGAAERAARGLEVGNVHLSLSHDGGIAAAAVVLERGRP
jgi:holo-[acyl-carrier protein] synthase